MNLSRNHEAPSKSHSLTLDSQTSLLNAILESTADGLLVIDRNGRMVQYNQKFVNLWNMPLDILHSKDDDRALNFVLSQLKNPEVFVKKVQELYQRPDQESFDVLEFKDGRICERYSQAQVLGDEIVGRVWSFRDVTEKKKAEAALIEANRELESIMSSISDYVWSAFINVDGSIKYRYYSSPVEKITGRPASFYKEGPDRWLSTVYHDDLELVHNAISKLKSGESKHEVADYRILHSDGRTLWIRDSVNAFHLQDGRIRLDGVSSDITDQKFVEEHTQKELDQQNQLRAGAEKALQERDLFISIASHELKNPLTSLQLRIDLLNRSLDHEDLSKPLKAQLQGCKKSVDKFKQLINELLDISKIKAGGFLLTPHQFNLSELLNELIGQYCIDFERKGCQIISNIEDPVVGNWDKIKIGQVLTNLLSNALKYSEAKPIEINLRKNGNQVVFEIKDQGIGMSEENIKNLFQPYTRFVDEASVTGLGLGLYISKQIVEAHGGKIIVQSELGIGSTFKVEMPASNSQN